MSLQNEKRAGTQTTSPALCVFGERLSNAERQRCRVRRAAASSRDSDGISSDDRVAGHRYIHIRSARARRRNRRRTEGNCHTRRLTLGRQTDG